MWSCIYVPLARAETRDEKERNLGYFCLCPIFNIKQKLQLQSFTDNVLNKRKYSAITYMQVRNNNELKYEELHVLDM